jgi:squalene synthase HpnC
MYVMRDLVFGLRSADSAWASESLPVALRALPARPRRQLNALYEYARFVAEVGDEPVPRVAPVDRLAALDLVEAQVRDLYDGRPIVLPAVAALAPIVATRGLPMEPLLRLIDAGRADQRTTRYATFDQLNQYCRLSANPLGELVLHLFGEPVPEQVALSDRICTALRLIEILLHVAEDRPRGRVYLPAEDLGRFGVQDAELDAHRAGPALRALIEFQAERAGAWLEAGAPLVSTLRGWARLWVTAHLAGGRAALASLAHASYDPLSAVPSADGWQVLAQWLTASVKRAG